MEMMDLVSWLAHKKGHTYFIKACRDLDWGKACVRDASELT